MAVGPAGKRMDDKVESTGRTRRTIRKVLAVRRESRAHDPVAGNQGLDLCRIGWRKGKTADVRARVGSLESHELSVWGPLNRVEGSGLRSEIDRVAGGPIHIHNGQYLLVVEGANPPAIRRHR